MSKINKKDAPKGCYAVKEPGFYEVCQGCCFAGPSFRPSSCTEFNTGSKPCASSMREDGENVFFKKLKKSKKHNQVLKELIDWLESRENLLKEMEKRAATTTTVLDLRPQEILNKIKELKDNP